MIHFGVEAPAEAGARENLLDRVMGPERWLKPSQILRDGRKPATGLSLVARDGKEIVGTVRLWEVDAGGCPALLLGPLAVDDQRQGAGIGGRLMRLALAKAKLRGHKAVILVGDPEYYARFGFSASATAELVMPEPVEARRFLACELEPGALAGATGRIVGTGKARMRPRIATEHRIAA